MKNYLLALFRLLVFILLMYLFFSILWFYDISMDPITLFARFFSPESIEEFYKGGFSQLEMSDASLFALIPGFKEALTEVAMPFGPVWLRPLLFGYIVPFTLAILFSSFIIWNFRVIYSSLAMRHRVQKLRKQIDSISDMQNTVVYDSPSEKPTDQDPPSKLHQLIHS